MEAAGLLVAFVKLYAAAGLAFAILFVRFGVERVDAAARGAGFAFRMTILPGVAALWPVLLARWIRS